jgi:myo-inositol 2-dehydrogenase/D-chiro-inositol 1-dehydrogenase
MDQATMLIKTRAGALITISMSRSSSYGYDQRTEFFGTKGCARVNNLTEDGMEIGTSAGLTSSRAMESFPQRFNEGFRFELDEFHGVLTEDKKWPIGMETCMAVQRIADAAGVSAREGRVVML